MSYDTEKSNVKLEKKVYKPFTINLPDLVPVVKQYLKERNAALKDELVWLEEFIDLQHAYNTLCHFLNVVYNYERPHSSLGYLLNSSGV
jgi:hypothetical protein